MIDFFRKRPWIWIVIAFLVLFTAWTCFMTLAIRYRPESVPLEHLKTES